MSNHYWNNQNKDQKTDNENGARGKGKAVAPKGTYGNDVSFSTELSDEDSDGGNLEMGLKSPPKTGHFKPYKPGFGTHKNK